MIWIKSQEALEALGISRQALHKAQKAGRYISKRAGHDTVVLLSTLPVEAQQRYWDAKHAGEVSHIDTQTDAEIYASAPEHARKKADKYLTILNQSAGLSGDALKAFAAQWNSENPDNTTSYACIMSARKAFQLSGVSALLGKHGKRSGTSAVPDDLFAIFKSLYLKEGRPSAVSCWKITLGYADKHGLDTTSFPSHAAFVRRIEKEIPQQALCTARDGAAAANKKYGYYIKRSYDDVLAGECFVSDHAQVDIACSYSKNGRMHYGFPWVTAWRDFKSGKWVGWDIHMEDPCSDHIFQAFYRSGMDFGICSYAYLDNGKDYRCKDFAGGRRVIKANIDSTKTTSLTAALGINVIYAWPYNAQSKSIERDFLRNKEWFSKHDTGYRGGNVVERPESLNDVIKSGKILEFTEFQQIFNEFIINVINKSEVSSGYREGMSPDEMWDSEIQQAIDKRKFRHISGEALKLFCTRTSSVREIGRRGFHDAEFGVDYWSNWMEGLKGKKVFLRRDPQRMEDAWVFDAISFAYLGQATINHETPALADKTDIGRAQLKQQIDIKKASNKLHRAMATADIESMDTRERMMLLAGATRCLSKTDKHTSTGSSMCFPETDLTSMDIAISQRKVKEREGLQDFSILTLNRKRIEAKKRQLIVFPSEREAVAM